MAVYKIALAMMVFSVVAEAQRPFYAGLRAVGYPEVESNALTNRFSEREDVPIEARGDRGLVNRLNSFPVDKQPFWFINWRQYRDMMQKPQTYQLRDNIFNNRI